jgi:iron uptake system component EfeO
MPESDSQGAKGGPGRGLIYLGVGFTAVLALAGAGAFYWATINSQASRVKDGAIALTITASACEPNAITVAAGKRSFQIRNTSDRTVEWEILNGVLVVAERENIVPGFFQTLSADLAPGDYEMTCGLLSNPRGVLHVKQSDEYAAKKSTVSLRNFLGPLSEYKVFMVMQTNAALDAATQLADAIKAGDLAKAQSLYEPARLPYKRLEPVAYRLSDLKNAIDPVADYFEKREADPAFVGFHRIEYGLFEKKSLDGLEPIAARLVADMTTLKDRLRALKLDPSTLIALPGDMAAHMDQAGVFDGENHYAHTDLQDIDANLEGIEKIAGLLTAVAKPVDAKLAQDMTDRLAEARAALTALKVSDAYPAYNTLSDAQRDGLKKAFAKPAEVYGRLNQVIGVS